MRTGILSDDNAKRYQPLPQTINDKYFVRPHLHTHGLYVKPMKGVFVRRKRPKPKVPDKSQEEMQMDKLYERMFG